MCVYVCCKSQMCTVHHSSIYKCAQMALSKCVNSIGLGSNSRAQPEGICGFQRKLRGLIISAKDLEAVSDSTTPSLDQRKLKPGFQGSHKNIQKQLVHASTPWFEGKNIRETLVSPMNYGSFLIIFPESIDETLSVSVAEHLHRRTSAAPDAHLQRLPRCAWRRGIPEPDRSLSASGDQVSITDPSWPDTNIPEKPVCQINLGHPGTQKNPGRSLGGTSSQGNQRPGNSSNSSYLPL